MNRRARHSVVAFLASFLAISLACGASDGDLLSTYYYLTPIGTVTVSVPTLIQTAQANGFAVVVRTSGEVATYRGGKPTTEPESALVASGPLLYVDGGGFLLRVTGQDLDYTVRPGDQGYTLVLLPHRDLPFVDAYVSVITSLQEMGIVGSAVDMSVSGYEILGKSPALPGLPLDSSLYALTLAPDWFAAAASLGLTRQGLRVEVVAEKLPGGAISDGFRAYVVSETEQLAKLLCPIHLLVDLARSGSIGYVRPPYRPQPVAP